VQRTRDCWPPFRIGQRPRRWPRSPVLEPRGPPRRRVDSCATMRFSVPPLRIQRDDLLRTRSKWAQRRAGYCSRTPVGRIPATSAAHSILVCLGPVPTFCSPILLSPTESFRLDCARSPQRGAEHTSLASISPVCASSPDSCLRRGSIDHGVHHGH
jgi:hypothetical protein